LGSTSLFVSQVANLLSWRCEYPLVVKGICRLGFWQTCCPPTARGFKFDWRALIPRLRRRTDDAALDDAALEGVAGGAASAAMILPGGWTFGG